MTTTRFSEPARLSTPANHCFNENRWSATWFWSLLLTYYQVVTKREPARHSRHASVRGKLVPRVFSAESWEERLVAAADK